MRAAALETEISFWPLGESAEPRGPWKPWVAREIEISAPAGRTAQPAGVRRGTFAPADGAAARASPRASAGGRRTVDRFIESSQTPGARIRRARADGIRQAAIVAADGHRLPIDGGAGHDATQPASGAAPGARGGDRRGRRRAAPARLPPLVPQLRRPLRAAVGARHRPRA